MNKKILVLVAAFVMLLAFAGIASASDEVELRAAGSGNGQFDLSDCEDDGTIEIYILYTEDAETQGVNEYWGVGALCDSTWQQNLIKFNAGGTAVAGETFKLTYTVKELKDAGVCVVNAWCGCVGDKVVYIAPEEEEEEEDTETETEEDAADDAEVISSYLRGEGDIYRINIYNEWTGDENDMIIDKSELDNIKSVTVTFTVDGLANVASDPVTAYVGGAVDADWAIQYWGEETPVDGVTVTNATVNEDGTYTVKIEFSDESARTAPFLALFLTANSTEAGDKDTEIVSGLSMAITDLQIEHYDVAEEEEAAADDAAPKTADAMNVVVLGFVAVVALAGIAVAKKRA